MVVMERSKKSCRVLVAPKDEIQQPIGPSPPAKQKPHIGDTTAKNDKGSNRSAPVSNTPERWPTLVFWGKVLNLIRFWSWQSEYGSQIRWKKAQKKASLSDGVPSLLYRAA